MQIAVISLTKPLMTAAAGTAASEIALAIQRVEMDPLDFSGNQPIEKLLSVDGYIIVGDSAEMADYVPEVISLLKTQNARGKPILGISAGAALLVKHGLVPGLWDNRVGIMLGEQPVAVGTTGTIRLSTDYQYNAFTRYLTPQHILSASITTPKGQFIIPPGLLAEIESQGLNVFVYCNAKGEMISCSSINPTGSIKNIAAIANKAGNVMAIVPHVENTLDGDAIFKSMRDHIASGYVEQVAPLFYWPR